MAGAHLITWKRLDLFFPFPPLLGPPILDQDSSWFSRCLFSSQSSVTASFVVSSESQMNSLSLHIFALISKVIHTQRRQLENTPEIHTQKHTHTYTHSPTPDSQVVLLSSGIITIISGVSSPLICTQ